MLCYFEGKLGVINKITQPRFSSSSGSEWRKDFFKCSKTQRLPINNIDADCGTNIWLSTKCSQKNFYFFILDFWGSKYIIYKVLTFKIIILMICKFGCCLGQIVASKSPSPSILDPQIVQKRSKNLCSSPCSGSKLVLH